MKVIVFGDIHGNLPALETCFEKAEEEGYDRLVHTGDVVGYGPFPAECVAFLHERNIPGVRGNFDENIGWRGEESGAAAADVEERGLAETSFEWTARRIDHWTRRWLADLPFDVRLHAGDRSIAVYHSNPVDMYSLLPEDMPEPSLAGYGDASGADVLALGHVHRPYHRKVDGRHFVNAGSVGRPRDQDPRTGYAVIEANSDIRVGFRRFEYDIERTAKAIEAGGLPAPLAGRIRKGT